RNQPGLARAMVLMSRLRVPPASRRRPAMMRSRSGPGPIRFRSFLAAGSILISGTRGARVALGVQFGDHVIERLPVLTASEALFGGLPADRELRRMSEHVVIELLGVDRGEHRDRSPASGDDDGLPALFQL